MLVLAPQRKRLISDTAEKHGLLGADPQFLMDLICMPFYKCEKDGPAPKGTMERRVEKALKGGSLDADDDYDV